MFSFCRKLANLANLANFANMYPPPLRSYKAIAAIAVGLIALSASVSSTLYGVISPAAAAEPGWYETGYPVQPTELWRLRACKLHWDLIQRYPHLSPQPLHAVLDLNPTAKPFSPPYFSADSAMFEDPQYSQIHTTILDAYHSKAGAILHSVAEQYRKPLEGTDAAKEDKWLRSLFQL
ncbi:hypothetical protein BGZ61DRAFT_529452 [Ilyonectria robusta]|uniref:uncharacterized protein n=1 Tax=Ilyonectria robusta TaxID=1079257 RepID=UPI001E8CE673|nr:uncharacterized protein BGZ61DRAFT_529452 [Ilyonectria robusta]KAH8729209.1 hypothetical protein BGZ61DRAFT_529452 [Ilyonectria robusta]